MSITSILKISVITLMLFNIHSTTAYKFQGFNKTFLKSIVKEAMRGDMYHKRHPNLNDVKPKTYKELHPVTKQDNNKTIPKHTAQIIFSRDQIDAELNKDTEVLTEALRMGLDHKKKHPRNKKVYSEQPVGPQRTKAYQSTAQMVNNLGVLLTLVFRIQLEDMAALKYPIVVKVINLDKSIRRAQNQSRLKFRSKTTAEKKYEELKEKRKKRQELQLNMTLYQQQHEVRMQTVIKHMEEHFMSSLYLFEEVQRIKETGRIRDYMRELLDDMDAAGNTNKGRAIRSLFTECYNKVRPTEKLEVWNALPNNNLVIHYVMDPPNDGVD